MTLLAKQLLSKAFIIFTCLVFTGCFSEKTADEYLNSAKSNIANNDPNLAIIALKNAIKLETDNVEARALLGEVYLTVGQSLNAEKELSKAIELGGTVDNLAPLLAEALMFHGDYEGVLELASRMDGDALENMRLYQALSLSYLSRLSESPFIIFQLLENDNVQYQLVGKLLQAVHEKSHDQIKSLMSDIASDVVEIPEALFLLGKLSLHYQQFEQANDYFTRYQKGRTSDLRSNLFLAKTALGQENFDRAEQLADFILAVVPKQPIANEIKAFVSYKKNNYQDAIFHADKAIQNGLANNINRLVAGMSNFALNQYESAYVHFSKIKKRVALEHPVHRIIVITEMKLGKLNDATETILNMDTETTGYNKILMSMGSHFLKLGESDNAQKVLAKASTLKNVSSIDLSQIGLMKLSANDITGIKDVQNVVDNEPGSLEYRLMLVSGYIYQGELTKALVQAETVISSHADLAIGYNLAGSILVKLNDIEKAASYFDQALTLDKNNLLSIMYQAMVAEQQGDIAKAYQALVRVTTINPEYIDGLMGLYRLSKLQGNTDDALAIIEKVVANSPENRQVSLAYAAILLQDQQAEKSTSFLLNLSSAGDDITLKTLLANSYIKQGKWLLAKEVLFELFHLSPDNGQVFNLLISVLDQLSLYKEAISLIEDVKSKNTDLDYLSLMQGYFLTQLREYQEAVVVLKQVKPSVQDIPQYQGILALAEMGVNADNDNYDALLKAYQENPASYYALAISSYYVKNQQANEAISFLKQHVDKHPNRYGELMILADLVSGQDAQLAIAYYKRALAGAPNHIVVLNNLAWLYLQDNQISEAREYSERAVKLAPNRSAVLDTYAQILLADNDAAKAMTIYQLMSEHGQLTDQQKYSYTEALLQMNYVKQAKSIFATINGFDDKIKQLGEKLDNLR